LGSFGTTPVNGAACLEGRKIAATCYKTKGIQTTPLKTPDAECWMPELPAIASLSPENPLNVVYSLFNIPCLIFNGSHQHQSSSIYFLSPVIYHLSSVIFPRSPESKPRSCPLRRLATWCRNRRVYNHVLSPLIA
jgi:hypothetical protein